MSRRGSLKKDETQGASASSEETTAARHDAQFSDGADIGTNMTAPVAPATNSKDSEHETLHTLGSGLFDASLHSLGLTAGTTSSAQQMQQRPELLPPPPVSSMARPKLVTEASQTPDYTSAYRSLTLQYSPRKMRQVSSTIYVPTSEDSHVAMSPKSVDPDLGSPASSIERFSPAAATSSSSTVPPTVDGTNGALPPETPKHVHSEDVIKSSARVTPTVRSRSPTTRSFRERQPIAPSEPSQSPRFLVPWIESAIRNVSSALGSPRALVPLGSFAGSRQSPHPEFAAGHSKFEETIQCEDALATPCLPWATLIVMWLLIHAHWKFLHRHYLERCASIVTIVRERHWDRVVLAALHHSDVSHLMLNAVSFFFKGLILEAALGATHFAAVLAIVAGTVGLLNIFVLQIVSNVTCAPYLQTLCSHTFAGVITALGLLNHEYFGKATIHFSEFNLNMRYQIPIPIDLFLLAVSSLKNMLPAISGLLVGLLLAKTALGKLVVGIPYPRRDVYLVSVPETPVTYLFVAAVAAAHLYGPYAGLAALDETKFVFRHPFWRPLVLSPLYVSSVYELVYMLLSVLAVGQRLERDLGHSRLLALAPALVVAVNVFRGGSEFVAWKHLLAFRSNLPPPAPHADDCSCDLVGAMLALKAFLHSVRPDAEYQLASMPIRVHFWPGVLLELVHLHCHAHGGSSWAHVTGVLLGLGVARFLRGSRWRLIPDAAGSSTALRDSLDYLEATGLSFD